MGSADSLEPIGPGERLRKALEPQLDALNARFLAEVTHASHLTDGEPLDTAYYVRHRIETIKRIRMTARTDALALAAMIQLDYEAARPWARYACEELDHDGMFYSDLARHGVSRDTVDRTEPLPATVALGSFLEDDVTERGPLAAVAYSVFVEWNSERYSRPAVEKARHRFGDDHVHGSSSHLAVDEGEDHVAEMFAVAERLCSRPGERERLGQLIEAIARHLRDYFSELAAFRGGAEKLAA